MKVIHWSSVYDGEDFEGCPNCGVIGAPYAVLTLEGGKVKVCCLACKEAFLSTEKKVRFNEIPKKSAVFYLSH
jgi:hypothetical protein